MSITSPYQYAVAVLCESEQLGAVLARMAPVRPCWSAAVEAARLSVVEKADGMNVTIDLSGESVQPVWQQSAGEPYVAALRVTSASTCGVRSMVELPAAYFDDVASAAVERIQGEIESAVGQPVRYVILAVRSQKTSPAAAAWLQIEEAAVEQRLLPGDYATLRRRSQPYDAPRDDDLPAFVPQQVLHEMTAITLDSATVETGGILLGHLCRDLRRRQTFVEVTAQIPARHACSESTRLTFTPETWTAADAARQRRERDERFVGWWHSHPAASWAESGEEQDLPSADVGAGRLTGEFFSSLDCSLHRACFASAFSLALVVSDNQAMGVTTPMFGWRRGMIARRGYYVVEAQTLE